MNEIQKIKLPVVLVQEIYHAGTLNEEDKGRHSFEGHGLSVSNCPEAWISIASLSGEVHTIRKEDFEDKIIFLDFYKSRSMEEVRDAAIVYALESGIVEPATVYSFDFFDDDLGRECSMSFLSYTEATESAESYGILHEDIVTSSSFAVTEKGLSYMNRKDTDPSESMSVIIMYYAEHLYRIDGVWWDEELDVSGYSAPRGVIFDTKGFFVQGNSQYPNAIYEDGEEDFNLDYAFMRSKIVSEATSSVPALGMK